MDVKNILDFKLKKTMRSLLLLTLVFFSFKAHTQDLKKLLSTNQSRTDTLISFNDKEALKKLPLTIIKGKEEGPNFTIIAGVHGYEYPPIIAVQKLMKEIEPENLKGNLIIIPIANLGSFYKRVPFVNPLDNLNLNTTFPGDNSGSITEKIAAWITKEIIPNSDVFLDIHGGDAGEDLMPFICYYNNEDMPKQTQDAKALADASGMDWIVSYPYTISQTEPARYAFKQAVQDGKTALSIEAGKLGTVQAENVARIKNSVYNMLQHKKMYATNVTEKSNQKTFIEQQTYVRVPESGIFYSKITSGQKVDEGQELGHITDAFGKVIDEIYAPVSGYILYKVGTPPVNKGETLFCIGY